MTNFFIAFANTESVRTEIIYCILFVMLFVERFLHKKINAPIVKTKSFYIFLIANLFVGYFWGRESGDMLNGFLTYTLMPSLIFYTGYVLVYDVQNKDQMKIYNIFLFIVIGCAIHAFLNCVINIGFNRMEVVDFFSRKVLSATNQGSINTVVFSLFPCFLLTENKKVKYSGYFFTIISFIYALVIGSRTVFVILLISTLVVSVSYLLYFEKSIKKRKLLKWMILAPILILFLIVLYEANLFQIKTLIESSNLVQYFKASTTETSDKYRLFLFGEGIKNLFTEPFGAHGSTIRYYHNYWLDMGKITGYVPVLLTLLFDIIVVVHVCKIVKNKRICTEIRLALLGVTIGILSNFFVEPILEGYINLFYRFCLINGVVEGVYVYLLCEKKSEELRDVTTRC